MSRSTRQAGHVAANAVALAYLIGAAAQVAVHGSGESSQWLLMHLLVLGAVTNAIVTWTSHFTSALLQQLQLPVAATAVRLVVLNAAVLGVLIGVTRGSRMVTIGAAALLTLVLVVHLGTLVRTGFAGRDRRFAPTVRFYWAATCAALMGVGAGLTLALGELSSDGYERVYLTHVHLGLLGWVALTVLGTEFTLWPIALRTRMVPGLEQAATVCLLSCAAGLALLAYGLLWWVRPIAILGLALYAVGVGVSLDPFLRTARRRMPTSPATVMLAASTGWLLIGIVYDAVALSRDHDPFTLAGHIGRLVPWLLTGFVVQVLIGALSYLVPILLGGPPSIGRRTAAAVNRMGYVTAALLNVGVVLLAVAHLVPARLGWLLIAAAITVFAGSVVSAAVVRARPGGRVR